MSVPTINVTTPATSVSPAGRTSGAKELRVKMQAASEGDLQKRKVVITNEGYTVYARETSSNSVTGEWSACLGEICGGTVSLGDIIIGYDNGGFVFSVRYEPCELVPSVLTLMVIHLLSQEEIRFCIVLVSTC
jgi:hypothetical protein